MGRSVMGRARSNEVCELIATTLGAQLDMVDIEKRCVSATWHPAAVLVAQQHCAA